MLSCKSYSYIPLPQTPRQICCLGMLHSKREGKGRMEGSLTSIVFFGSSLLTEYLSSSITALHAAGETHHHITCTPSPPNRSTIMGSWSATCSCAEAFGSCSYRHSKQSCHASVLPRPLRAAAPHTTPALAAHCTTSASWTVFGRTRLVGGEMNFEL